MESVLKKTKAVSEELGVNPTTVQRWIKYFDIPCETNGLGHYLIDERQLELLRSIKEQLDKGLTMRDIRVQDTTIQQNVNKETNKKEMIAATVMEEKLQQLLIHIEQLERKLSVKADEVVEYRVLQHRTELDNLFTMINRIEERMSKMEQRLIPAIEQRVVGGVEDPIPEQLKKSKKSKIMRIFSF